MIRGHSLTTLAVAVLATVARAEDHSGSAAFERLKNLAGEWEGTAVWTGVRTGNYPMNASYYLTGNGSALVTASAFSLPLLTSARAPGGVEKTSCTSLPASASSAGPVLL